MKKHWDSSPPNGAADDAEAEVTTCWLECGDRPVEATIAEMALVAASLDVAMSLIEQGPGFAVLEAKNQSGSLERFVGSLALAGASFAPGVKRIGQSVVVFIVPSTPGGPATGEH